MDWNTVIFNAYTLKEILTYGAAILLVLIVLVKIKSLLKGEQKDKYSQTERCKKCGWEGRVSVYAGRCPQCNEPLGAQKARK